jgi:hypothetical protein
LILARDELHLAVSASSPDGSLSKPKPSASRNRVERWFATLADHESSTFEEHFRKAPDLSWQSTCAFSKLLIENHLAGLPAALTGDGFKVSLPNRFNRKEAVMN